MDPDKALATTTTIEETAIATIGGVGATHDDTTLATSSTMQQTTIAELRPTSYDKILEARVYRKWVAVTYLKNGTKKETGFCCILIDREVRNKSYTISKTY